MFSSEYCRIFENSYFKEYLWTAASTEMLFSIAFGKAFI